jgi:hypothetical protein
VRRFCVTLDGCSGDDLNVDVDAYHCLAWLNRACGRDGSGPWPIGEHLVLDRLRRRAIGASRAAHPGRIEASLARIGRGADRGRPFHFQGVRSLRRQKQAVRAIWSAAADSS